jgi:hypothetical protein
MSKKGIIVRRVIRFHMGENRMNPFDYAWTLLKEAEWHPPNTFNSDEMTRYLRYHMNNFHDKLSREGQGEAAFYMQQIEGFVNAEKAGEEYFGFMTPEFAVGQMNNLIDKEGLKDTQLRNLE